MPLFSTIIPVHNRCDLVVDTIESVLSQSCDDQQVIVVDDGSTDDTLAALERFADRLTILTQANAGPGAARNLGAKHAKGKYLTFLDSDDRWFPWTLATYQQVARQYDAPAFIAGKPFVFHDEKQLHDVEQEPLSVNGFADYLASGQERRWFGVSSFVIRADAFAAVGGFENQWINGEDADLAMKLGESAGFVQVAGPHTFGYRRHEGSLMSNFDRTHAGVKHMIDRERADGYPGGRARRRERLHIIGRHVRPVAREWLKRGQIARAWELYRDIWRWELAQGRFKFVLGFPPAACLAAMRRSS